MILISHRGNINGIQKDKENSLDYIHSAISMGYDCEIDVWKIHGQWFLGHDIPQYGVNKLDLINDHLWCHAKNVDAFLSLKDLNIHTFWHNKDDYTLTSKQYIWQYPTALMVDGTVCVMPEWNNIEKEHVIGCVGVCSDFIERYK